MTKPINKLNTQSINGFGLTQRDMDTCQDIFNRYPEVKKVYIFGSRAKGTFKLGSDVDLAVMNEGVEGKTLLKIKESFEESSLPYKVDLIYIPGLKNSDLTDHIFRVGTLFYERPE